MKLGVSAIILFILLSVSVLAACPEPDIKVYSACTDKCPDAVEHTFGYADCINACLAMWSKMQDDSAKCGEAEREAQAKAQLERDDKIRGIEEAKVHTVSTVEGMIWLTSPEGLANKLTQSDLLDMKPGSVLSSEPDSTAAVTLKDGSRIQLGPDSQFTYKGGEPIIDDKGVETEQIRYTYQMSKGRVRYKSGSPNTKYDIHTSQGTIVNDQTDFIVEASDNLTKVYLYEGRLGIENVLGEKYVLNASEMIALDSLGTVVIANLNMEDWDGIVNSIETGVQYVPAKLEGGFLMPEMDNRVVYMTVAMAFVLIVLIAVIVIRKKKS